MGAYEQKYGSTIIFEKGFDVGWVVNFKIFHGGNGINGMSPSYEKAKGQLGM